MSITRTHRAAVVAGVLAAATGLSLAGSSVAAAHRGAYDSATCEESLTRVWDWPGDFETGSGRIVLFSDAYESHVLRQPPCAAPPDTLPRHDPGRVGHQHSIPSRG